MLKLQYHRVWRADSLEKTLMLGKTKGKRIRGQQRMRWLRQHRQLSGHESEQTLGDGEGQESLLCCSPRGHKESDTPQRLNNDNISKIFMFHCRKIGFGFLWSGPWPSYPARFHSVILSTYSVFLCFLLSVSQRGLKSLLAIPLTRVTQGLFGSLLYPHRHIVGPHPVDGMKD